MAWVRQRGDSFFLVESYRDEAGLSRQRTLGKLILENKTLGIADLQESLKLLRNELIEAILEGKDTSELKAEIATLEKETRVLHDQQRAIREAREKAFIDVVTTRAKGLEEAWAKEIADIVSPVKSRIEEVGNNVRTIS